MGRAALLGSGWMLLLVKRVAACDAEAFQRIERHAERHGAGQLVAIDLAALAILRRGHEALAQRGLGPPVTGKPVKSYSAGCV